MGKIIGNSAIRTAGKLLKQNKADELALSIISTFRANHSPVLTTLINVIKNKMPKPLFIARRLKRLSSIEAKLRRFDNMQLDRMQDIGGARAVFKSIADVKTFACNIEKFYTNGKVLKIVRSYDYISKPKMDGYRSYHIVFKYHGLKNECKGYQVELQLRDLLQHYWATAVEILALGSDTNIKAGVGGSEYKRFFWLCAELLAGNKDENIKKEIRTIDEKYKILALLNGLNVSADKLNKDNTKGGYYIIALNYETRLLKIIPFASSDEAKDIYQSLESHPKIQSVLVSVSDVATLKKAYPNFYLDAKNFIREVVARLSN